MEEAYQGKESYQHLLALDNVDIVANAEKFKCPICFEEVDVEEGVTLRDCLHNFCKYDVINLNLFFFPSENVLTYRES